MSAAQELHEETQQIRASKTKIYLQLRSAVWSLFSNYSALCTIEHKSLILTVKEVLMLAYLRVLEMNVVQEFKIKRFACNCALQFGLVSAVIQHYTVEHKSLIMTVKVVLRLAII